MKWDAHSHFGVGSRRRRSTRAGRNTRKPPDHPKAVQHHTVSVGSRPSTYFGAPEDGTAVGACPVGKAVSNRIFQAPPSRTSTAVQRPFDSRTEPFWLRPLMRTSPIDIAASGPRDET